VTETALTDETLKQAAKVNTLENFAFVFNRMLEGLFIDELGGQDFAHFTGSRSGGSRQPLSQNRCRARKPQPFDIVGNNFKVVIVGADTINESILDRRAAAIFFIQCEQVLPVTTIRFFNVQPFIDHIICYEAMPLKVLNAKFEGLFLCIVGSTP